jgi:hypothetical protein
MCGHQIVMACYGTEMKAENGDAFLIIGGVDCDGVTEILKDLASGTFVELMRFTSDGEWLDTSGGQRV